MSTVCGKGLRESVLCAGDDNDDDDGDSDYGETSPKVLRGKLLSLPERELGWMNLLEDKARLDRMTSSPSSKVEQESEMQKTTKTLLGCVELGS